MSTLELKPVTVSSTRIRSIETDIPVSVSTIQPPQFHNQQLSVKEVIEGTPGVFILNDNNFAQDVRISIRGFGSRASFGIRGVKIVLDGIPESTPDGQGQIDNIDPGFLGSTEIIRSPVSGLYGNASGGVISFETKMAEESFSEIRLSGGSFGFQKYQMTSGIKKNKLNNVAFLSHTRLAGYRDHSKFNTTLFNNKLTFSPDEKNKINILLNYNYSPEAQDPGGLTLDEVNSDRDQARTLNVEQNTGESVEQGRIGFSYIRELASNQSLQLSSFYTFREFYGRIPFAIIDLRRHFYGFNGAYTYNINKKALIKAGLDLEFQNDHRRNFTNEKGIEGTLIIDQNERFYNSGLYIITEYSPFTKMHLLLNLRYDLINIKGEDNYFADGDNSGDRSFDRLNPLIGLNYSLSRSLSIFANFSTAFETPSLNELSSNPSGSGGFNNNLDPQSTINIETGIKGRAWNKMLYSISLFRIETKNELIPYQLEDFPDREFYENAGSTIRNGVEIGVDLVINNHLRGKINYTYSDFKYKQFITDGNNFSDNRIPGIPQNLFYTELKYSAKSGFKLSAEFQLIGQMYAENANSVKVENFSMLNIRGSHTLSFEKWELNPFLGINNVLSTKYFNNIRINAFGGRFYEPAPKINFYGGVKIKLTH
nr:TonB-dependent receptor [Mangrovivirga halotolerans]